MRDLVFLVFDRSGITGMRKRLPTLRSGEYAVRVDLRVSDQFFAQSIPSRVIEITESDYPIPEPDVASTGVVAGTEDMDNEDEGGEP